jgi:LysR family transcriptional regulator, hydrogen peroxide-inducible genes activator
METHQVRYFLVLARTLNFTKAAEECNVTQPSLTRAVKKLEEELGGALFHRERANTHLTVAAPCCRISSKAIWRRSRRARWRRRLSEAI